MVKNLLIISLVMLSPGSARAISDPLVAANTFAIKVEQKLQTLKLVQMVIDLKNSYETARLTYNLAKAGYEKVLDKNEWKALLEYHKYRLKQISNPSADAYDSSLYRSLEALDGYFDEYMKNTKLYSGVENMFAKTGRAVDNIDAGMVDGIKSNTPLGSYYQLEDKLVSKTKDMRDTREMNLASTYLKAETTKSQGVLMEASDKAERAKNAFDESEKLKKVLFYAEQDYALASQGLSQSFGSESEKKEAHLRYEKSKQILEDIKQRRKELRDEMESLTLEIQDLNREIVQRNDQLKLSAAAIGLEKVAQDITFNKGLSTGAGHENMVLGMQKSVLVILVISMALALLWRGMAVAMGKTNEIIPHDVFIGFIAAIILLAPMSPVSMKNISKSLAILVDGTEGAIYKNTMKDSFVRYGNTMPMVKSVVKLFQDQDTKGNKNEVANSEPSKAQKMAAAFKIATAMVGGEFIDFFLQPIVLGLSLLGVATLMIAMSLRIGIFWVLMGISPILIALSPLPFARKSLLPKWGMAVFAVIIWGPIAKTTMSVCQEILSSTTNSYQNLLTSNSMFSYLSSSIEGLLIMVLMVISPFIAFSLAQASFDGLVSGAMSVGTAAASVATNGGLSLAAGITTGIGKKLLTYAAKNGSTGFTQFLGKSMSSVGSKLNAYKVDIKPNSMSFSPNKSRLFQNPNPPNSANSSPTNINGDQRPQTTVNK